jgi:nicotinic acid mononucleotide adenylyltransferase
MATSLTRHDYTIEGLSELATDLTKENIKRNDDQRISVCIAIAGGGGHAISSLAATSGASQLFLDGDVTYSRKAYLKYVGMPCNTTGFYYSSFEAAKKASEAALQKALVFRTDNIRRMPGCIGIGSTSSLLKGPDSKAYVVATRADGTQLTLDIILGDDGENRTRLEKDIVVSHFILRAIDLVGKNDIKKDDVASLEENGISISAQLTAKDQSYNNGVAAAKRILEGKEQAVVLLPVYDEGGRPTSFRSLERPILPNGSLIFPGSYNPPHKGHISLAKASLNNENERKRSSRNDKKTVFFELSLVNPDKPSIDAKTVEERISKFLSLDDLPTHWGIILSRAPLFFQKVSIFARAIDSFDGSPPNLAFVIGTDTLVRIVDKKYYNNSESEMVESLCSMEGVNFLVGGRLEQKKDANSACFVSGSDEVKDLPEKLKQMFTIIKEEDFRVDISSSQIREQLKAKSSTFPSS